MKKLITSDLGWMGILSFVVNITGVGWMISLLFFGALAIGVSSSTSDMQGTMVMFLGCVACFPVLANIGLVGLCIYRRQRTGWVGWLIGSGLALFCGLALVAWWALTIATRGTFQ
jgi:hypothetical protein